VSFWTAPGDRYTTVRHSTPQYAIVLRYVTRATTFLPAHHTQQQNHSREARGEHEEGSREDRPLEMVGPPPTAASSPGAFPPSACPSTLLVHRRPPGRPPRAPGFSPPHSAASSLASVVASLFQLQRPTPPVAATRSLQKDAPLRCHSELHGKQGRTQC